MNRFATPPDDRESLERLAVVLGGGVVGTSIARCHIDRGMPVVLADIDEAVVRGVAERIAGENCRVEFDAMSFDDIEEPLILVTIDPAANRRDPVQSNWTRSKLLIIESIVERLDAKQALLNRLMRRFGDRAIYTTNTSTLRIATVNDGLVDRDKLSGLHFFMPVPERHAVEWIVPAVVGSAVDGTANDESARDESARDESARDGSASTWRSIEPVIRRHAERLGKTVFRAPDTPGFIVNRLLSPYLNEALLMACEGAGARAIRDAALEIGMPISPFELIDLIGVQTMFDAGRVYWQAFPDRFTPSPTIGRWIKRKRRRDKAADNSSATVGSDLIGAKDDSAPERRLVHPDRPDRYTAEAEVLWTQYRRRYPPIDGGDIRDRLALPMINEMNFLMRGETDADVERLSEGSIAAAVAGGLAMRSERALSLIAESISPDRRREIVTRYGERSAAIASRNRWIC